MKISANDVFIYPTDTVWGIGSSLYSEIGYNRIAEIKKTTKNKPLSIMFSGPEEVMASFKLPSEMNKEWLEQFFVMETTLGIPLSLAKIRIPKWAIGESHFVSIRCLNSKILHAIREELNTPFFTTSLNLTGKTPITKKADAINFHQQYAADCLFFKDESDMDLSGTSSTIVFISENLNFEIKREGRRIEEVKNHLMKLFSRLDIE